MNCEITIDPNGLKSLPNKLEEWLGGKRHVAIITDTHVAEHWLSDVESVLEKRGWQVDSYEMKPGESSKNLTTAEACWKWLNETKGGSQSVLLGLGGGVVTDLSGFVASTYHRGIPYVPIPTTLLAMVDAAIGGKNGINFHGKNQVGTFHHPIGILIDPQFLKSLPLREFRAGLAEVIKMGFVWDPPLLDYLSANKEALFALQSEKLATLIGRACQAKVEVIQSDVQNPGVRDILNWGHTFAHALESVVDYQGPLHGEAVAIGMCCAATLSWQLGGVKEAFVQRHEAICQEMGLNTDLPEGTTQALMEWMRKDKKSNGEGWTCVVVEGSNQMVKRTLPREAVENALTVKQQRDSLKKSLSY